MQRSKTGLARGGAGRGRAGRAAIAAACVGAGACGGGERARGRPEGDEPAGRARAALQGENGIASNGFYRNGAYYNGIASNGIASNGFAANGIASNGIASNGIASNGAPKPGALAGAAFAAWFARDPAVAANLMSYVAKCALGPGQALHYAAGGQSYAWPGALGLAPAWENRPPAVAEQEWVSACLLAFTNKCENHVMLSLRAPTEGAPDVPRLPLEPGEAEGWTYEEAAFFGNVFAAEVDANACDGEGGDARAQTGLGRECGSDPKNCGYETPGPCAQVCARAAHPDGHYASCAANGRTYSRVVTVFLDPATWRGSMDCRNQGLDDELLSVGKGHVCARGAGGQLACWGRNDQGQVGGAGAVVTSPRAVNDVGGAVQLSAGEASTCARRPDGAVWCWGQNHRGELGDGTTAPRPQPAPVLGLDDAVYTSGGFDVTCARTAGGEAYCWGNNASGQLGRDPASLKFSATPLRVEGLAGVVEVATGEGHNCARLDDNGVWCWGENKRGELGDGTTVPSWTPVRVQGLADAVQVSAFKDHSCARRSSGAVACWGENKHGELGAGPAVGSSAVPVGVVGMNAGAVKVTTGRNHSCALKADGKVFCWGGNGAGQLGDGTTERRTTPVQVSGVADARDVAAGFNVTCARHASGAVSCWGSNDTGQLGIGTQDAAPHPTPQKVLGPP